MLMDISDDQVVLDKDYYLQLVTKEARYEMIRNIVMTTLVTLEEEEKA